MASNFSPVEYSSPVNPSLYPTLAVALSSVGLFFLACYEITYGGEAHLRQKKVGKELGLAGAASIFLGFGTLFLLLWTGVYV